ncbi:MAG: VOC family protein [Candidatus Bathyarchaeota archaeon]|nr:VOC family protein [Candidatus Bathyarchaeum tardum]WGM89464.1 MAG: VOC family protein [Candidatus Bathyarchaeum tardum]
MDHTVIHFEIPAENVEKIKKFYSNIFGWKIEKSPMPMDYWLIQTVPIDDKGMPLRPGINGGIFLKENPKLKPVNYISVESVDEIIQKVKTSGGKIIQQKTTISGVGSFAIALDPEGNEIGLLQQEIS